MRLIYLLICPSDIIHVYSLRFCILFQSESEWLLWMWKLMCSPPSSDLLVPLPSSWLCFVTLGTPTQWSRPERERFLSRPYFSSRGMSTRASWWTRMEQVSHTTIPLFKFHIFLFFFFFFMKISGKRNVCFTKRSADTVALRAAEDTTHCFFWLWQQHSFHCHTMAKWPHMFGQALPQSEHLPSGHIHWRKYHEGVNTTLSRHNYLHLSLTTLG